MHGILCFTNAPKGVYLSHMKEFGYASHSEEEGAQRSFARKVNFMRPFDGRQPEVSSGEKWAVSKRFTSYAEDKLLNNFDLPRVEMFSGNWLFLREELNGQEDQMSISLKKPDKQDGVIEVRRFFYGYPREMFVYKFNAKGEVIRKDMGDQLLDIPQLAEVPLIEEEDETLDPERFLNKLMRSTWEDIKQTDALESAVRLNSCPIDMAELQGLIDLVDGASPFRLGVPSEGPFYIEPGNHQF
jgi:hypothetical protein